jgi:hypothetical protein
LATILFIGYLIALSWGVTRIRFFRSSGLTQTQLILLFCLKVAVGIFYGWLGVYYASTGNMRDTWAFHTGGLEEEILLLNDPVRFLTELIHDPYEGGKWKLFQSDDSYWNDLKGNALIKGLAILNLITGGHYFVNVLFYNFFGLIGLVCFYRVLTHRFHTQPIATALTVLLLPSVLFWTSGIHKEGILFTAIGLITYCIYFSFQARHWSIKRIAAIFLSLLLILVFRNHLLLALLPALLLWALTQRFPNHKGWITAALYTGCLLLFFLSPVITPRLNLPEAVAQKQHEFLQLKGGKSSLPVEPLEPTPMGFLKNLPQSLDLALTRPHLSNVRHLLSLAAYLEVIGWAVILLLWIWFRDKRKTWPRESLDYFLLTFSIAVILIIGFSINNLGAIVRYRSIVLAALITPLAASIDWKRIMRVIKN